MVRSRFPPDRVQQPSVERGPFTGDRAVANRRPGASTSLRPNALPVYPWLFVWRLAPVDWLAGHSQVAAELALPRLLEDVASSTAYFPRLKLG